MLDQFWSSWSSDYIRNLPPAAGVHGESLKVGSVVLVQDEACNRLQWPLGVVVTVFPGKDGFIRSAEIRTAKGLLKRPVQKLYDLEVTDGACDLVGTSGAAGPPMSDTQTPSTDDLEVPVLNETTSACGRVSSDDRPVFTRVGRLVRRPQRLEL